MAGGGGRRPGPGRRAGCRGSAPAGPAPAAGGDAGAAVRGHRDLASAPCPGWSPGSAGPRWSCCSRWPGPMQVPLDELVAAPATGDPRVHPRPLRRDGVTYFPLTRRPGGLQAYKIVFPAACRRRASPQRAGPRGVRVAVRPVRAPAPAARRAGPDPGGGGGGGVRHPRPALAGQPRSPAGRGAQPLRPAGGAGARKGPALRLRTTQVDAATATVPNVLSRSQSLRVSRRSIGSLLGWGEWGEWGEWE